jgi:TnpA family transposase
MCAMKRICKRSPLLNYQHRLPLASAWGEGTPSSFDGQRFRAGGRGEAAGHVNARYGNVEYFGGLSRQLAARERFADQMHIGIARRAHTSPVEDSIAVSTTETNCKSAARQIAAADFVHS